jgi:hypothetical protein
MHVYIRLNPACWETILVPTEAEALRRIQQRYPHAVVGPGERDCDRRVAPPTGRIIKRFYKNPGALARKSSPIAVTRKDSEAPSAKPVAVRQTKALRLQGVGNATKAAIPYLF